MERALTAALRQEGWKVLRAQFTIHETPRFH